MVTTAEQTQPGAHLLADDLPAVVDDPGADLPGGPVDRLLRFGPLTLVLIAVGTFALATLAVVLGSSPGRIAPWWPAAGLAVVAAAWAPRRRLPLVLALVLATTFAANLGFGGRPLTTSAGMALANTLEVLTVAWVLRRDGRRPSLGTIEDVVRFFGAVAAGAAVMGLVAGLTVELSGYSDLTSTARTVMLSHAASIAVIAPFGLRLTRVRARLRRVELGIQTAALAVAVAATYGPDQGAPLTFVVLPFLVWGALRFPPRVAASQLLAVAIAVTTASSLGGGPFTHEAVPGAPSVSHLVQAYLLTLAVVTLPLAVSVSARRITVEGLAASERLFRQGFNESLVGMMLLRRCPGAPDHTGVGHVAGGLDVVELNAVTARLLEDTEDDLLGACWTSRLEDHDRHLLHGVVAAVRRGSVDGWRGEVQLRTHHGHRWLEVALSRLPESVGRDMFVGQLVDATARREAEERLTAQALQDSLTGLANRVLLRDRIGLALQTLPDDGPGLLLLFCDLDDFKHVNDSAGHTVGDQVLVEVAHRLQSLLRPGDLAARLGGDEFVLLRPVADGEGDADDLARAVLDAVSRPVVVGAQPFTVGASIGIVRGARGATPEDLLRDADAAMYAAKAEGKRRAVVYSDVHRERALRSVRVERELRHALEHGGLDVHLQPVLDLRTGATTAAEALVRWHHPERGLLAPGEWLDVAEKAGLMPELGAWVLRRSCALAAAWPVPGGGATASRAGARAAGRADAQAPAVHVNVSARQLDRPGFVDVVRDALAETGLPPHRLVLEFTETHLDEVSDALLDELATLRDAGIALAADDYGTGYSPLTRIIELPISMIKIDRRFVADMLDDVRSRAIVTTLVRLGESLGLEVVAEGVETPAHVAELRTIGCRSAQGYVWSRPLPPEDFAAWLAAGRRGLG
ncbi:EAL domain-containing protein [Actinotalea sp. AC32]|nr:EAL domain-containing protein [Actinotalea sp. AC32]